MASDNKEGGGPRGRIIVVGAGYAGLSTAIELTRKGFEVEVIEHTKKLTSQGLSQHSSVPPCAAVCQCLSRRHDPSWFECRPGDGEMGEGS